MSSVTSVILVLAILVAIALAAPKSDRIIKITPELPRDLSIPEATSSSSTVSNVNNTVETTTTTTTTKRPYFNTKDDSIATGSYKNTSTFSCWGRTTGYYADVKLGCNIYHFCSQMDGIGGEPTTYQRMSYVCMDGSLFDQKDLNCVMKKDLKVPCDKAEAEYESSNKQFGPEDEPEPSVADNLAASLMMNPITRFIAGR